MPIVPHNDCVACHADPHNKRIQGKCTQCHTVNSFAEFIGRNRFDHTTTDFALKGKHKTVDCFSCHKNTATRQRPFHFRRMLLKHNALHAIKMCTPEKWETTVRNVMPKQVSNQLKSMTSFNHSTTDYPLEGKHIGVDCKQCHKGKYTDPINFSACKNCHKDYHQGEFVKNGSFSGLCSLSLTKGRL